MRAINGKLDMSKHYKLVSVESGKLSEHTAETCENCGQVISNVAVIKDDSDKVYRIGLDCMQTIVNMSASDIQQAKNIMSRRRAFIKELGYAECFTLNDSATVFWFYVRDCVNNLVMRGRGDYSLYKNIINTLNIPLKTSDDIIKEHDKSLASIGL